MFIEYGRPFNYPVSNVTDYSFLPFGSPYKVLQTPYFHFKTPIRIFTIILSSACDMGRRNYVRSKIRDHYKKYGVYSVFALGYDPACGDEVNIENGIYGDLFQFSHVNSYKNISLSVLYSLLYIHNHHIPVDYVF